MKALISGGGIAGLSCAAFLANAGWNVTVIERAPTRRSDGYMIDFFGPGYDAAESMGIIERLRQLAYPVQDVSYVDRHGRDRSKIDYGRFRRALGGRLITLMRPDLEKALVESLAKTVRIRWGTTIEKITQDDDGVTATLDDATVERTDVLIGADGIHSPTRAAVFGAESGFIRYLGFHTAAFVVNDSALQSALGRRFILSDTVNRTMGLYSIGTDTIDADDVAAFAAFRAPDPSRPSHVRDRLRSELMDLGPLAAQALDNDLGDIYYDQVSQIEMNRWHSGRVVLAGDAYQAVSLMAGQGASLAVAGAQVLAEELTAVSAAASGTLPHAGDRTDPAAISVPLEEAFRRYEARWQPVVTRQQAAGRRSARWIVPATHGWLLLRRVVLRAMALPGIDQIVGRAAVGTGTTRGATRGAARGKGAGRTRGRQHGRTAASKLDT